MTATTASLLNVTLTPSPSPLPAPYQYNNPFVPGGDEPGADAVWVILSGFLILTMQTGFGMVESGLASSKNQTNMMQSNMFDAICGGFTFWLVGFGLAFGDFNTSITKGFAGRGYFAWNIIDANKQGVLYAKFFYQLTFATSATTIASGAVGERSNFKVYLFYDFLNAAIIYPFPAHWMWHEHGFLRKLGAYDFAGSGVVGIAGGSAALAAVLLYGPRHRRFGKDKIPYPMSKPRNIVLGTFLLWWGSIGFNCGSTFGNSGSLWKIAARVGVVTMNGAISGGVSALVLCLILEYTVRKRFILDVPFVSGGVLAGLNAVTAGASVIEPWHGMVIGFIGGFVANLGHLLLEKLHVDDPVRVVGVHCFAGWWAYIACGLFAKVDDVVGLISENGAFRGGGGHFLGAQLAACCAITAWSMGMTAIVLLILKYTFGLRPSLEDEAKGSDLADHNIIRPNPNRQLSYLRSLGVNPKDMHRTASNGVYLRKVAQKENPVFNA